MRSPSRERISPKRKRGSSSGSSAAGTARMVIWQARDAPVSDHCGTCARCIAICPTNAIVAPYRLDARRCISYLTIEHHGPIPEELRPLMGNRIYGCDDCQLVCPWNKYAKPAHDPDFAVRNGLDAASLAELFAWTEEEFERRFEGSAIRRIRHARWPA